MKKRFDFSSNKRKMANNIDKRLLKGENNYNYLQKVFLEPKKVFE